MFSDEYKTVEARAEASITDRGSLFTAVIVPADTPEKAEEWFTRLSNEHTGALDHVYAMRIGLEPSRTLRVEGSGQVSKAVADIMDTEDITNVLIAVFRKAEDEFPKSPSEQAYRDAAANALKRAKVVTRILYDLLKFQLHRDDLPLVSRLITDNRGKVIQTIHEPEVAITVKIRKIQSEDLKKILIDATHGRTKVL